MFQAKKYQPIYEHAFIRNIFDHDEIKLWKSIEMHIKYHEAFRKML